MTNLEGTLHKGSLVFYNREGKKIISQLVTLGANGRNDFSAHDLAGRSEIGLVEWVPAESGARFQVRNVRYYYQKEGNNFDAAFQLDGAIGNGELLTVPLDTVGASSVLEIGNTKDTSVNAEVSIYESKGGDPIHHATYKMKAHSTYHIIVDGLLNGQKGIATVKGDSKESLIADVMQYGRSKTLGIQSLYGIQAQQSLGRVLRGSYNTFLNQDCRLLLSNPTAQEVVASVSLKRYDGTSVGRLHSLKVPAYGLNDYNLCGEEQSNVYGVVTVTPSVANTIAATVLRIGMDEQYRFPTPVRE